MHPQGRVWAVVFCLFAFIINKIQHTHPATTNPSDHTTSIETPHNKMSLSKPTIEQDAAKARDEFVIAVWTGTLPQTVEHEMRSELTSVGNFYDDLLSLDNHTIRVHLIMHDLRIAESAG